MLSHFPEPLFPRMVSTVATRDSQKVVYDRDRALLFYQGALRVDCKLAIYPNYQELLKMGLFPPGFKPKTSHLYIDLDLKSFNGDRHKLDLLLKKTLRTIKLHLNGAIPTVLWSGGGYHIHQPLDPDVIPAYEELQEFKIYGDPSVKFMRYAERALTAGKADPDHNISFNSCMARVPCSRNSKYEGKIAEVRVLQKWNGVRAHPTTQFMLSDFLIWLVQADFDSKEKIRKRARQQQQVFMTTTSNTPNVLTDQGRIGWIEKLLQTPIEDYRKHARDLILVPYLVLRRRITNPEQICDIVMHWADRCAELRRLDPSRREFEHEVRTRVREVEHGRISHMSLERLKEKNPDLYKTIQIKLSGDI